MDVASRLEIIEEMIEIVKAEKNNLLLKILNRLYNPTMMFTSSSKWLSILREEREFEIRKIEGYIN